MPDGSPQLPSADGRTRPASRTARARVRPSRQERTRLGVGRAAGSHGGRLRDPSSDSTARPPAGPATATATYRVAAGERVRCTFTNTQRGSVTLRKTTNGVVDPSKDILSSSPAPACRRWDLEIDLRRPGRGARVRSGNLIPAQTYKICETPVPAGFTSFWKLDGVIVTPYNPDASKSAARGSRHPLLRLLRFSRAGARLRGGQLASRRRPAHDRLLEELEPLHGRQPGGHGRRRTAVLPQASSSSRTCSRSRSATSRSRAASRRSSSSRSRTRTGRTNRATPPTSSGRSCSPLASTSPPAPRPVCRQQAVLDGQTLLDGINFTGSGDYLGSKSKDPRRAQALSLAATLDRYNNGNLC